MITTIQIEGDTMQKLKQLKEQSHAKSFNEVILSLLKKKHPTALYGILHKEDIHALLKGLRDKHERF